MATAPVSVSGDAPGLPTIAPEPALVAAAIASTLPYTAQATYTVADVQTYLTTHPQFFATADGTRAKVAHILFISATEASGRTLGEPVGRAPSTLVCYVEVYGALRFAQHSSAPARRVSPRRNAGHRRVAVAPLRIVEGHAVFDAQTGDLLFAGTQ